MTELCCFIGLSVLGFYSLVISLVLLVIIIIAICRRHNTGKGIVYITMFFPGNIIFCVQMKTLQMETLKIMETLQMETQVHLITLFHMLHQLEMESKELELNFQ